MPGTDGPLSWYRVHEKPAPGGKTEVWIEERTIWFYLFGRFLPAKWNVGVREHSLADNRHRYAMSEFIRLVREAQDMLVLEEQSKNDAEEARKYVNSHRQKEGISEWYQKPRSPREDALPDLKKDFEELKKKFGSGFRPNAKARLGTPEWSTRSRYYPEGTPLPAVRLEGKEFDHEIPYKERNRSQPNQGKQKSGRGGNQGNQQKGIRVIVDDDNTDR